MKWIPATAWRWSLFSLVFLALGCVGRLGEADCTIDGGACGRPSADATASQERTMASRHIPAAVTQVLVSGALRGLDPDTPLDCGWMRARAGDDPVMAFGLDGSGDVVAMALVGRGECRLDATSTAKTLVALAAGWMWMSPAQRRALEAPLETLDVGALASSLATRGIDGTIHDPSSQLASLWQIRALVERLRGGGAARVIGITPDREGFDHVVLTPPRLTRGGEVVELTVSVDGDAHELKAVSDGSRVNYRYLVPEGFPDLVGGWPAYGAVASTQVVLSWPATNLVGQVRVLAPSVFSFPSLTWEEGAARRNVTVRSMLGNSFDFSLGVLPSFIRIEGECRERLLQLLVGRFASLASTVTRTESLEALMERQIEEAYLDVLRLDVCEAAVAGGLLSRALDTLLGVLDRLRTGLDALGVTRELAFGPAVSDHRVDFCAACPGATETSTPPCTTIGARIVCNDEARCVMSPEHWRSCSVGRGACLREGLQECVGSILQCSARAGAPAREVCVGSVDEDCDGLTDCADPDCVTDRACARCATDRCSSMLASTVAFCSGSIAITCRAVGPCVNETGATDCASAFPHMTGRCRFGACESVPGTCTSGWGDCDGVSSNGCEQSLNTSVMHCGGCSRRCNSGEICASGVCRSTCVAPTVLCAGVCVDPSSDRNNCGRCGAVCTALNGSAVCSSGRCVVAACNAGRGDCDAVFANGCEADLASDPNNCGSCFNRCGAATCVAGRCVTACTPATCASLGRQCGSVPDGCGGTVTCPSCPSGQTCNTSGRCVTTCIPATCASLGRQCGSASDGCGGTVTCPACSSGQTCNASGRCVSVCTGGTIWCGGTCIDTSTDTRNCGGCGNRCATGEGCSAGSCVASVCSDYLRIITPTMGPVSAGSVVRYQFTAPGCPSSQQYIVAFRQCCTNRFNCAIGYSPGVDPDIGCPGTSTIAFTGTTVDVTLPSVSGKWRTSVYPVGRTSLAAPFVVLDFGP